MLFCKSCGNDDKETLEEIKPLENERQYNFIIVFCKLCLNKSYIHVDD